MKRLFSLALALAFGLCANAKIYYLLPTAAVNAPVNDVLDYLPYEGDGTEANVEVSPERRAYNYLKALNAEEENYLTIKDVLEGALLDSNLQVTTLWVNIDRWGFTLEAFDGLFTDSVATALGNFSRAGGNLYLTKQAARLVSKMLRTDWWPSDYCSNGYFDVNDDWQMCFDFCTGGNLDPQHEAFQYMENAQPQDGLEYNTRFPLVSGDTIGGKTYRRSDNNCAFGDWMHYLGCAKDEQGECRLDEHQNPYPAYGGCDPLRRSTFEEHINGKVLGGWGHTRGLDYAGMIEFYPTEEFTGRVIINGLAAYQWGAQNTSEYNVKNLTRGCLEYLNKGAEPTAVEHNRETRKAEKTLVNGRLVINRQGHYFTALGSRLK